MKIIRKFLILGVFCSLILLFIIGFNYKTTSASSESDSQVLTDENASLDDSEAEQYQQYLSVNSEGTHISFDFEDAGITDENTIASIEDNIDFINDCAELELGTISDDGSFNFSSDAVYSAQYFGFSWHMLRWNKYELTMTKKATIFFSGLALAANVATLFATSSFKNIKKNLSKLSAALYEAVSEIPNAVASDIINYMNSNVGAIVTVVLSAVSYAIAKASKCSVASRVLSLLLTWCVARFLPSITQSVIMLYDSSVKGSSSYAIITWKGASYEIC